MLGTFVYMDIKQGSMGKPSPIYDIFLADNNEEPVAQGETGEICIKLRENQVGLLYQYHKDVERTAKTFATGIYHTGDLAYMDKDGYYWFVGRKDDIIKSSGYRIGPFEVESALHEHPRCTGMCHHGRTRSYAWSGSQGNYRASQGLHSFA